MRRWLVAALAAMVVAPTAIARAVPAPAAPAAPARAAPTRDAFARVTHATRSERREHTRRPDNSTLSVTNELGMVDQLRRQLIADNEDYLPSDSEGIPMRARLSDESAEQARDADTTPPPHDTRFKEVAAREARLARYLTLAPPVFRASTHQLEPIPDKEEHSRDQHEPPLSQEEIQEKKQYGDEPPDDDKINDETTSALDHKDTSHHEEINDSSNKRKTEQPPKAILTRNFVSVEKFDEDYEFKTNRHFPHRPIGGFDEAQKPNSEDLKGNDVVDDAHVIEMENRVEEEAHAQVMYDADPPPAPAEFLPRAHDDTTTTGDQTEPATTTVIKQTSNANGPTDKPDISISKRDLLYYMDEEKLAKSNLSIGFNADVAIDYKDFAQRENAQMQGTPEPADHDATPASKKYRVLKMRGGGRRSGSGGRRFIQEEGAGGVAILTVDAGPFPEFRLPRDRRQYMSSDVSDDVPPTRTRTRTRTRSRSLEPQRSLDHAPS